MPVERDGPVGWWSPDPRGVLPLDGLRVTASLRKSCRRLTIHVDTAFDEVDARVRRPDGPRAGSPRRSSRRTPSCTGSAGRTASRRAPRGRLVGGLYGLAIGGLFAGESMFHRATDASKVALVSLVERLAADAGTLRARRLLDVQWRTDHLASLGVVEVSRPRYLRLLDDALALPPVL